MCALQVAVVGKPVLRLIYGAKQPLERYLRRKHSPNDCHKSHRQCQASHCCTSWLVCARRPARYATRSSNSDALSFPLKDGMGEVRAISYVAKSTFHTDRKRPDDSRI